MSDFPSLEISLYDQPIGVIAHLPGDRNLFTFHQHYIDDPAHPMLSLSFKDNMGNLITDPQQTRTRLSPFFANLLPEGHMRDYLASQAGVHSQREFFLLAALGKDLPGAIKATPVGPFLGDEKKVDKSNRVTHNSHILRFSLAGVQLKFSALWETDGRLTIPIDGVGGSWIVKFPSAVYPHVPENEFFMMEMARKMGIDVPETKLIPIDQISGIPSGLKTIGNHAFIIERFDRDLMGHGIHIEDFAQVFGLFPEKKYQAASYRNIAQVIWSEVGEEGIAEFMRRFVFNALIGNGDMHLKNWSLIYRNKTEASLAPAYDFVSTIPYISNDQLALTFVDSKAFNTLSYEQFKRFAAKAQLPENLVLESVYDSVKRFAKVWKAPFNFQLDQALAQTIDNHLNSIPIWTEK